MLKGSGEEPVGGYPVPLGRHQHVNDLPELVDRAVEIDPPPGNFDICFVNKPSIPKDVPAGACRARGSWGGDSYVKVLDTVTDSGVVIKC